MAIISLSGSSFAATGAATQVRRAQGDIKDYTGLLTKGIDVSREKIATSSNVAVQQTQTKQWMENMQRLANIMTTAITGLTEVQAQHKAMLELAEQVASGTKTADEIAILNKTFVQFQQAANAAAQNAEFLDDSILATDGGTAANVANANGSASASSNATAANTFCTTLDDRLVVAGNIFGSVEDVSVSAVGAGSAYKVVVTMKDAASGASYTLESGAATPNADGYLNLVSSLDGQSSIQVKYMNDVTGITGAASPALQAAAFETALKDVFQVSDHSAASTAFTSDYGQYNGTRFTLSADDVTKGAGIYRVTQSIDDRTKFTVIAPDGSTETLTIPSNASGEVDKSYYAFGMRITAKYGATGWDGAAALSDDGANPYTAAMVVTGTAGYSRTVAAGSSASISVNISDHRNAALGIDSVSIDTIANAAIAKNKLTETIAEIASTLGELNAIAERAKSTMNNLGSTLETLGEVLGNIQNVDIVEMTEMKLGATIQQMTAIDAFASDLRHRQQVMQTINQIG